jgi:hypothetical protein
MVCAEKFSMSVGSALFIVKNYKSSQEHGRPAETKALIMKIEFELNVPRKPLNQDDTQHKFPSVSFV